MSDRTVKPIRKRKTLNRLARRYLEVKHRYEFIWELLEGIAIAAVFTFAILGRESVSHRIELASHILVGLLILFKLASVVCLYIAPRIKAADTAGVET